MNREEIMKRSIVGLIFVTTICIGAFLEARYAYSEVPVSESSQHDVKGTTSTVPSAPSDPAADNTKKNVRDKDNATLTPLDQSQGSGNDVEVTRLIRKRWWRTSHYPRMPKTLRSSP